MTIIYNFSGDPIYLDLGGALAAFGLIFAVYQLRKPKWDLVLRIRNSWQKNLFWILGGIGLFLTLIRVLLFQFTVALPYPFNNALFYEVTAYLFFIASPLSLIFFSTKTKNLFNEKNSRKFYEVLIQEISKNNEENVNAALTVLLDNFPKICEATHKYKSGEEISQSAKAIMEVILSDESIVKILTTKRLDALQYIFSTVEKYKISRRDSGIGIPKIVHNLFKDKESFFYKQLSMDGLALSSNIYESIFDSPVVLRNFDLFGYPTLEYSMRRCFGVEGIAVLEEALSRATKTYLRTGSVPSRHINSGLSYLSDLFGDLCYQIADEERQGIDTKYSLKNIWAEIESIAKFLGRDYLSSTYQEGINLDIIEKEKKSSNEEFDFNWTVSECVAATIYKAFEQLSHIDKKTDIYYIILDLFDGLINENKLKIFYREPFEKMMWKQINKNIVDRIYPAVLRTYLTFIGFCLVADRDQGWVGNQTERMRSLLYDDLKPLLDRDERMVNDEKMKDVLLPQLMDYKDGKFTYKLSFGRGKEKVITPPKEILKVSP